MLFYMPTKEQIQNLQVGDFAPDCFGRFAEIVEITAKAYDVNGKMFACYYVKFGQNNSRISHSMKEGELERHVGLSGQFTSHELDDIEGWFTKADA